MQYPSHDRYELLYARYLKGDRTMQMLDIAAGAGLLHNAAVLDLCAGGGRLSLAAHEFGADVTAVDESAVMLEGARQHGLRTIVMPVERFLYTCREFYNTVFCQQGVNYWLDETTAKDLPGVIRRDGLFIFNTFNTAPSTVPTIKQYHLDGAMFVEVSWLSAPCVVQHVQIREGEPPHTTTFKWISRERFHELLDPAFDCTEIVDGASSIWVCKRRPK